MCSGVESANVAGSREGLIVAPTTPPECVNEKERGQEESTTEVLTEGTEGLRLHLFWLSTLPARPQHRLSLLLASVIQAGASPSSSARSISSLLAGEKKRWKLHLLRARCGLRSPPGERGCAGPPRLSHGGLAVEDHSVAHHMSHASWSRSLWPKQRQIHGAELEKRVDFGLDQE